MSTVSFRSNSLTYLATACLFAIAPMLLMGVMPVGSSSEAREGQVIEVIRSTGEWILPLRNGLVPSKPPLYHWIGYCFSLFLGEADEFCIRLPSLLFATGTLLLTMYLGYLIFAGGARDGSGKLSRADCRTAQDVGLLSGMILSTTYGFVRMSIDARVDMTFCFFVCAALFPVLVRLAWVDPYTRNAGRILRERDFVWFYLWSAFAVLAKGPLGLVLPAVIVFSILCYLYGWHIALRVCLRPRWGWVLLLVVALPWYLGAALRGNDAFIWRQVVFENLLRVAGADFINSEAWWFYLPSVFRTGAPWTWVAALLLGLQWLRNAKCAGMVRVQEHCQRVRHMPLVWFIVGIVLFSIPSGKRHSYMLPLLPGIAIWCATALSQWARGFSDLVEQRFVTWNKLALLLVLMFFLVLGFVVELFPLAYRSDSPVVIHATEWFATHLDRIRLVLVTFAILLCIIALRARANARASEPSAWMPAWFGICVIAQLALCLGFGAKNHLKSFASFGYEVNRLVPQSERLLVVKHEFDEYFDPLFFYIKRSVQLIEPPAAGIPAGVYVIAKANWFNRYRVGVDEDLLSVHKVLAPLVSPASKVGERSLVVFSVDSLSKLG